MYFEILINETNSSEAEIRSRLGTEHAVRTNSHGSKQFNFEHPIEIKDIAKYRVPGEPARGWQISQPYADSGWCVGRSWGKYVGARVRCWESEEDFRRNYNDYYNMSELIMSNPIWTTRENPSEEEINRTEFESKTFILRIVDAINNFFMPDDYLELDDLVL